MLSVSPAKAFAVTPSRALVPAPRSSGPCCGPFLRRVSNPLPSQFLHPVRAWSAGSVPIACRRAKKASTPRRAWVEWLGPPAWNICELNTCHGASSLSQPLEAAWTHQHQRVPGTKWQRKEGGGKRTATSPALPVSVISSGWAASASAPGGSCGLRCDRGMSRVEPLAVLNSSIIHMLLQTANRPSRPPLSLQGGG